MKLMALDVGDRRVGVAVSDDMHLIATPLAVIRRTSKAEDLNKIARLVREQGVTGLVIGHPLQPDGSPGPQALRVERYATVLLQGLQDEGFELSLLFWDESLSTQRAQQAMIASGRRARDRRARIDAVAAAVILQDYLDAQRPVVVGLLEEESP
jgi:putative Holliday junction resolvase